MRVVDGMLRFYLEDPLAAQLEDGVRTWLHPTTCAGLAIPRAGLSRPIRTLVSMLRPLNAPSPVGPRE